MNSRTRKDLKNKGFALVVALSLMVLLTIVAVGLLSLATVELRKSTANEARATAMANARLGLMMALNQLQTDLGDDRRITADASIFSTTKNPAAVGVWNGWSPELINKSASGSTARVDYRTPKSQTGFRSWLVSEADPTKTSQLDWHSNPPSGSVARLFTTATSGFDLDCGKIPVVQDKKRGAIAWAVTQENTKARINVGTDDSRRIALEDRLQTPSRPDLSNSAYLKQPSDSEWTQRASLVCKLPQAALDPAYGVTRDVALAAARDYTTESFSLLTNSVRGGVKADLTTGFDMEENDYKQLTWSDAWGKVTNPFRSSLIREYEGEKPLYRPVVNSAQAKVSMNFAPASVNHKFNVNGVPTFDMLRSYYRTYRHLYNASGKGTTAFERPYSHTAIPDSEKVSGRPFGVKTQPSLAPVLDRVNMIMSLYAKADGTICFLLTPYVTIWNPHNVDIETEGLVVYPWIDFAVYWNLSVTAKTGTSPGTWGPSLSRLVGEGYKDSGGSAHGRSSRPYFYLHLTQSGNPVSSGTKTINPPIHLEPGEVRVFALADYSRLDLDPSKGPAQRTWRMKAVNSASDITKARTAGIVLDTSRTIGSGEGFNYKLKAGDIVNSNRVEFDRSQYYYIVNMADSWQIKNPNVELMVETRPGQGTLPTLPEQKNLIFYGQVHSGPAFGKPQRDSFTYPSMPFELINERPQMVGSILTYHRTALAGTKPQSDLMFTTNPRQPYVTQYLGAGGKFQSGPHYESLMQGGTSLSALTMETTTNGAKAFYGPSHSANTGRSNLAFFEIPRSPTLSLGSFQHCDLTTSAFGCASQIGNSWASPYLAATSVSSRVSSSANGDPITPMLGVYDASYLANEALFDDFYLSGAAPRFGSRRTVTGSPAVWENDQISEDQSTESVLEAFFRSPTLSPLRNPRMQPYNGGKTLDQIKERLEGPSKCVRLASHLMFEGGFNINSTSEEAWTAVLSSLRGAKPASGNKTAQSRFRHILTGAPANMAEDDPWSGFRTLSDSDVKLLAKNIVEEIKLRGPFLSLGEFVNRRVSAERSMNVSGAIQSAIDKSGFNKKYSYASFDTKVYPNPENLPAPNTGTNTPGWLTQADVLHGLAPCMTARSDTFIVRSMGEARSPDGNTVLATVRLEAVVQRVPDWVDPVDDAALPVAELTSPANKNFGRRFQVVSIRELATNATGDPV